MQWDLLFPHDLLERTRQQSEIPVKADNQGTDVTAVIPYSVLNLLLDKYLSLRIGRSRSSQVLYKKVVLENFANFIENLLRLSLFLIRRLGHRRFPANLARDHF